jgi:hypothetical protein
MIASWTMRSVMDSQKTGTGSLSCQFSTGSWGVTIVERLEEGLIARGAGLSAVIP